MEKFNPLYEMSAAENSIVRNYLQKQDVYSEATRNEQDFALFKKMNAYVSKNKDLARMVYLLAYTLKASSEKDPSLQAGFVTANLFTVANSLDKQRRLAKALVHKTGHTPSTKKEERAISRTAGFMEKRLIYVRDIVIRENLHLTPVSDYLNITKRDLEQDVQAHFGFFLTREQLKEKQEAYINEISEIVESAGADSYKQNLRAYNEKRMNFRRQAEEEKARKREEKKEAKLDRAESTLAISTFHFAEDLKESLIKGCYFETCKALKKDLKDEKLASGYVVLQSTSGDNASCTRYYKRAEDGKRRNAYRLSSATPLSLEEAKNVCDKYYDKGSYLAMVFGMKELRIVYDPTKRKE